MLLVSVLGLICSFVPATGIGQASSIIERTIIHGLPSHLTDTLYYSHNYWQQEALGSWVLEADGDVIDVERVQPSLSQIPTTPDYAKLGKNDVKSWELPGQNQPSLKPILWRTKQDSARWVTLHGQWEQDFDLVHFWVDSVDFFSNATGIMVPGNAFKNAQRTGNYFNRGKHWQRPAHMLYARENRELFQREVEVRIHGNLTRAGAQKSLRVYFREEKQENNFFEENTKAEFAQIILRNGNSAGNGTHITDPFLHSLLPKDHLLSNPGRPVHVFINGEYWGLYHLRNRSNKRTLRALTGDTSRFELLDEKVLYSPERTPIHKLHAFITSIDLAQDQGWSQLKDSLDVENAVDYVLANTFFGNKDWIENNVKMYRSQADPRWKFLAGDMDAALNGAADVDIFQNIKQSNGLFAEILGTLTESDQFMHALFERYTFLVSEKWSPLHLNGSFTAWKNRYHDAVLLHRKRWRPSFIHEDRDQCYEDALRFCSHRAHYYEAQLERFGYTSSSAKTLIWIVPLVFAAVLLLLAVRRKAHRWLRTSCIIGSHWATVGAIALACVPQGLNARLLASTLPGWVHGSVADLFLNGTHMPAAIAALLLGTAVLVALTWFLTALECRWFELWAVSASFGWVFFLVAPVLLIQFLALGLIILAYKDNRTRQVWCMLFVLAATNVLGVLTACSLVIADVLCRDQIKTAIRSAIGYVTAAALGALLFFLLGHVFMGDGAVAYYVPYADAMFSWSPFPLSTSKHAFIEFSNAAAFGLGMVTSCGLFVLIRARLQQNAGYKRRGYALSVAHVSLLFVFMLMNQGALGVGYVLVWSSPALIYLFARLGEIELGKRKALYTVLFFATFLMWGSYGHIQDLLKYMLLSVIMGSVFLIHHTNRRVLSISRALLIGGMTFAQVWWLVQWLQCSW